MVQIDSAPVLGIKPVAENTFVLSFRSPQLSNQIQPGQFLNIKVASGTDPLLRRPFSVYYTHDDIVEIIFNVIGKGSAALCRKHAGDQLNVLGPLGVPFSTSKDDFDLALLVGGGLGVAPLPLTTLALRRLGKTIRTYLGARSASYMVESHLENLSIATDDGSQGFHGTVVDLLRAEYDTFKRKRIRIFACGPTLMLRAVAKFAMETNIPCEVSLEGPMACGFGICQGCPVELVDENRKYALMCKDGPTFDVRRIKF
ncbi:MAG: dihydroorotate dehydrogenase electron transfer subunit [Ignavibacteriae bacterium]|nr:dihydroorotate dehydrogenase electron transfer subunit [Ignavibacteriota bacterium]